MKTFFMKIVSEEKKKTVDEKFEFELLALYLISPILATFVIQFLFLLQLLYKTQIN